MCPTKYHSWSSKHLRHPIPPIRPCIHCMVFSEGPFDFPVPALNLAIGLCMPSCCNLNCDPQRSTKLLKTPLKFPPSIYTDPTRLAKTRHKFPIEPLSYSLRLLIPYREYLTPLSKTINCHNGIPIPFRRNWMKFCYKV